MESFLSKDISYLVSNKKEAKFAPTLGQISPVASPESARNGGNSSPHPSNRKDRRDGSSFKIVDTVSFLVILQMGTTHGICSYNFSPILFPKDGNSSLGE